MSKNIEVGALQEIDKAEQMQKLLKEYAALLNVGNTAQELPDSQTTEQIEAEKFEILEEMYQIDPDAADRLLGSEARNLNRQHNLDPEESKKWLN